MTSHSPRPAAATAALLALVFASGCGNNGSTTTATGLSTAGSGSTPSTASGALIEPPAGMFDLPALDPRSRAAFIKLLNDLLSPCGQPMTIASCVRSGADCSACGRVARVAYRNFRAGLPEEAVRELAVDTVLSLKRAPCKIDLEGAPSKGPDGVPIVIVVFSDFECPHCKEAGPKLSRLVKELGKVKVYYKHFPLSFHEHAPAAARAVIAADMQGKFWEFHDAVFARQDELGTPGLLESIAKELGLDFAKWEADQLSPAATERIAADRKGGKICGVEATPTIMINGRIFSDWPDYEQLKGWVEDELREGSPGG